MDCLLIPRHATQQRVWHNLHFCWSATLSLIVPTASTASTVGTQASNSRSHLLEPGARSNDRERTIGLPLGIANRAPKSSSTDRRRRAALVEDSGFEAIEAKDADEAVAILTQREDIRILFTDIDMPGSMDGIGLARKVRECRPDVEIIIVSGRVRPGSNVLPARSMFFSKPYNTGQVAQQLHRMASNDEP